MKGLFLVILLLVGKNVRGEYRISDLFNNTNETYENWAVTKEISSKATEVDSVVNDSLGIKITSLDGDSGWSWVSFGKNIPLDILKKIEKIEIYISFKTGFPIYNETKIGKNRSISLFGDIIEILQTYNNFWTAHNEYYQPGYYICFNGYSLDYINDNGPLDFKVELEKVDTSGEVPACKWLIIAYKNGYEIGRFRNSNITLLDNFDIRTEISKCEKITNSDELDQEYIDDEATLEVKIDKVIVYPDYNPLNVTKTDYIWGYTESEQTVNLMMEDAYTGERCSGCDVEIETGEGKIYKGMTDVNGEITFTGITTESDRDLKVMASKGEFYNYIDSINVLYYEFKVLHMREIPVLKWVNNTIKVFKTTNEEETEGIIPVVGALVELTNGDDYLYSGTTNSNGIYELGTYLDNNREISIKVTKDKYKTYTSTITPYLWSNIAEAFGSNNQDHIVRKPNTDEMEMLYTTGDSVVYGRSTDFGQTWELEILGKGKDPVLTRTKDGLIALWKENESTFGYSIKASPWTPVDTLISPTVVWFSEPVMGYNYTTDKTYIGYIGNRYLNIEAGDFILGSMEGIDTLTIEFDTVVSYYGEIGYVPMKSPVFSLYYDNQNITISHLIGFIDTMKNYMIKNWNTSIGKWKELRTINNVGQVCNAPTVDYYGEVTTFAYEVINSDGTRDIWKAKMVDGVLTEPEKVNTFTGVNKYPKVKNNYLNVYINNEKRLISEPGYGLTIQQNVIRETTDSIFSYDVNFKDTYTNRKGFFIWTEGENGFYRLKMKEVPYKTEPIPYAISLPQDTIEGVTTSPLYEYGYIGKKEPVERLNTLVVGLKPEMNYNVKVITSEGSPVKPQVIQIDGEVYEVVYGHANREDTTEIVLPKGIYEDNKVVISIDRKKGNPNRVAKVEVYEYESEGENVIAKTNKVKVIQPVNTITEPMKVNTTKEGLKVRYESEREGEVEISVYDIRGSRIGNMKTKVKVGRNEIVIGGLKKSGIYFVRIRDGEKEETKKINVIK